MKITSDADTAFKSDCMLLLLLLLIVRLFLQNFQCILRKFVGFQMTALKYIKMSATIIWLFF